MMLQCGKRNIFVQEEKASDVLIVIHDDPVESDVVNLYKEIKANIALISGVDWNDELTPYPAKNPFSKKQPFGGHMERYQIELKERILPAILKALGGSINHVVLAGYSLGGLFSFDAALKLDDVDGFVSCSSSFWYPDYYSRWKQKGFIPDHIKHAYFSIGDAEGNGRNPVFRDAVINTKKIFEDFERAKIDSKFVLEAGNHFQESNKRVLRGLRWIASRY